MKTFRTSKPRAYRSGLSNGYFFSSKRLFGRGSYLEEDAAKIDQYLKQDPGAMLPRGRACPAKAWRLFRLRGLCLSLGTLPVFLRKVFVRNTSGRACPPKDAETPS